MMIVSEDSFLNKRNLEIFTRRFLPEEPLRAAVLFIHGYAEHSGRYEHLARQMNKDGIGVFMTDLQGHGQSGGTRCDINNYEDYVDDLSSYFKKITGEFPNVPWYIMGHSMGGTLAVLLAYRYQSSIHGLIISAPALKIVSNIPKVVQDMVRYVTAVTPMVPVINLDTRSLSRDKKVVEAYKDDPLVYHGRIRARMAQQLVDSGKAALDLAGELYVPVWAGHGLSDRISDQKGTCEFLENLYHPDKTARYYEGYFHEILQEPEHEEIISDIIRWIDRHGTLEVLEKESADSDLTGK